MQTLSAVRCISPRHTLDLGQHILCLMEDGSLDLFPHAAEQLAHEVYGLHLENEETYRLFVCLTEQFQQKGGINER